MNIVCDAREQRPYLFDAMCFINAGVTVVKGSLPTGDYSIQGLENVVAVERKSLDDLVLCLGRDRLRFERELQRARGLNAFMVVIEGSFEQLAHGEYKSKMKPKAAINTVLAYMSRFNTVFHFAGSRQAGEYCVWQFLRLYLERVRKDLQAIDMAVNGDT